MIKEGTECNMLEAYNKMENGAVMSFKNDVFKIQDGLKIWNKRACKWLPCLRSLNSLVGAWWEIEEESKVEKYKPIGGQITFKNAYNGLISGKIYGFNNQIFKWQSGLKCLRGGVWISANNPLESLVNLTGVEMIKC